MTESETIAEEPAEAEPESGSRGVGAFGLGLFVGALVGAAVALLFAPGPGRDTRRHLRRRLRSAGHRVGDRLERWNDRIRAEIRRR